MKAKPSYKFYRACYRIARALFGVVYRTEVRGRENIPNSAAMVCSNHSSLADPIFMAFAFGIGFYLHFIAKVELFKIPVLSTVVKKLGAISVDRDMMDVTTIKETMRYFKNGEKVAIFPEGTRNPKGEALPIKFGAVKIAERANVPIIPVYIPRKKRLFSKVSMVIGEPYQLTKQERKRSVDDYENLSGQLMSIIEALGPMKPQ